MSEEEGQVNPLLIFPQDESNYTSPSLILAPLLGPHPPKIPTVLRNDTEFYNKFYIEFTSVNIVLITFILLFSIWVILMNTLIITGLLRKSKIRSTDFYLINLAVMDIIEGFVVIPLMGIVVIVGYFPLGRPVCHIWVFVDYFLIVTSSLGYCALLVNYLWTVRFPRVQTTRTHLTFIFLTWFASLVFWAPAFINNWNRDFAHGVCGYSNYDNGYYTLFIGIVGFLLPMLISIGCVTYSVVILRRKAHERLFYVRRLEVDVQSSPVFRKRLWSRGVMFETSDILKSQAMAKKHFPLIVYLLTLFLLCRIIFYIYFGVGAFAKKIFPPDLSNGLYWMMHLNAALSPIVHIIFDSDLRDGIRKMFGRKTVLYPTVDANGNSSSRSTECIITTFS